MKRKILHRFRCKIAGLGIILIFVCLIWACSESDPDPKPAKKAVTGVTVIDGVAQLRQGATSAAFNVNVTVTGGASKEVSWKLTDETGADIAGSIATFNTTARTLTVAETTPVNTKIRVVATSTVDNNKSNFKEVTVIAKDSGNDCCDGTCSGTCDCPATCDCGCQESGLTTVTELDITEVTAPVKGELPVRSFTTTHAQYSGAVTWNPVIDFGETFAANTPYQATITLIADTEYTFFGVAANTFKVNGANATNSINSGVVTFTFPATEKETPVAADFIVHLADLTQIAGSVTAVGVTANEGKTQGTITVLYGDDKSETVPQTAGTYEIFINVAEHGDYNAASELDMDAELVVELIELSAANFTIDPLTLYYVASELTATPINVSVTWHTEAEWNTDASIDVFYRGTGDSSSYTKNTAPPTAIGTYEVIIDIAAKTGYFEAVTELHMHNFEIRAAPVVVGDVNLVFTVAQFTDPASSISLAPVFSIKNPTRQITLTSDVEAADVRWTVNGGTPVTETKTLDVSTYNEIGDYTVMVEIRVSGTWYNKTFTFKVTL